MMLKLKQIGHIVTAIALMGFMAACKPASLEAPGPLFGNGVVEDFSQEPNIRVALYHENDLKANKKIELTFGAMDTSFITLSGVRYMVDWNDLEDFKKIKTGEKITFRSSGYVARIEKYGKSFKVIKLNEM